MKTVLQFLRDLAQHNDRAWFNEHKDVTWLFNSVGTSSVNL